jgi:acyl phosphate:glycerol-3-phosphate acyltransferase
MTYALIAIAAILIGYLSGSVNYAIIITKLVMGVDIRKLGNLNPGTSNVMREVGKPWGILVGTLDGLKGLIPIVLFRIFFFKEFTNPDFAILYLVGIAAVLGHCKSIFLHFTGGGGIGTMLGVSLFFVPIEFVFSLLLGGAIVLIFFKNATFKFGQKTPIMFVAITPFLSLLTALLMDIPLFAHISIGGHLPATVIGNFVMAFLLLGMNLNLLITKKR